MQCSLTSIVPLSKSLSKQRLLDGYVTSNIRSRQYDTEVAGGPAEAGRSTAIREGGMSRAMMLSGGSVCIGPFAVYPFGTSPGPL